MPLISFIRSLADAPDYYPHALLLRATFLLLSGQNDKANEDFSVIIAMGDKADPKVSGMTINSFITYILYLFKKGLATKSGGGSGFLPAPG